VTSVCISVEIAAMGSVWAEVVLVVFLLMVKLAMISLRVMFYWIVSAILFQISSLSFFKS
jgi:hypothetical protein